MDTLTAIRTAHRWFWTLTVVAVLLVGALTAELSARPSPFLAAAVAATGTSIALLAVQLSRLMRAMDRAAPPRRLGAR